MPRHIMFGDMAGDRADYIKGTIYTSRMTLPGEGGNSTIVSTKNMRRFLISENEREGTAPESSTEKEGEEKKKKKKKPRRNSDGELEEDDDSAEEEEVEEEEEEKGEEKEEEKEEKKEAKPALPVASPDKPQVPPSVADFHNRKENWEEHFQAGVQFWVHVKTGEVTNKCPYQRGTAPPVTEREELKVALGGFAPEMPAREVCNIILERQRSLGLCSSIKAASSRSLRDEEDGEDEDALKPFWKRLIGSDESSSKCLEERAVEQTTAGDQQGNGSDDSPRGDD